MVVEDYYVCGTCGKAFPAGLRARENHCRSTGHQPPEFECDSCPSWFRSQRACDQHMEALNHFEFECDICDETWPEQEDCDTHMIEDHFYCPDCERSFKNYNNIKMHLNSRVHRGDQIACPFCQRSFASATGVTHHLESGSCPQAPNLDRETIYQAVRSRDPHGSITKKLLEWEPAGQYTVTDRAWNGYGYECYFCHREFNRLQSLNQHVNSPAHQQNLYHCPNRSCGLNFKTLASTINHLESESCGFMRFDAVQRNMGNLVSSNRRLAF